MNFANSKNTEIYLNLLLPKAKEIFSVLLNECYARGINAQISESLRTDERQAYIFAQNKNATKAQEGNQSMHYYGLACDIFVNNNGKTDYSQNENIWKICQELGFDQFPEGMRWGGNFKSFKDSPHFELSGGKRWMFFWDKYKDYAQTLNGNAQKANLHFRKIGLLK